jgi:flagellar basal-body rod protein FlgC
MDYYASFKICASGLEVQKARMDVVTANLANISTTRTPEGGPYRKKVITLASEQLRYKTRTPFDMRLKEAMNKVRVDGITESQEGINRVYDPTHPDADKNGFVAQPNVNLMTEMADMIMANRAYEAMVTAFDSVKSMALKTLDIGK